MSSSMFHMGSLTAVGFEPTPFRNGALSHRLRPLGQTVLYFFESEQNDKLEGFAARCEDCGQGAIAWRAEAYSAVQRRRLRLPLASNPLKKR